MTWQFSLAGLLVGVLVGMTGMGGGSLMTPMLILLFGFDPKAAVGTDILHGAIFKSFGAWRHRQLGNVHVPLALWMLVGSAPLSLVGVQIASSFSGSMQSTMSKVVGATLVVGGFGFLAKTFIRGRLVDAEFHLQRHDRVFAVVIGAVFGLVVGLTSVGSGTFFGLAMLLLFPLSARRIVGTDMLHASLLLWVAGAGHLLHGNVNLHAMAWLLVGSIPGVLIGSHLSIRVPERSLRVAFGLVLVLSGIKIVGVPGANTIMATVLAVAALALVVWGVRQALQRRPGTKTGAGARAATRRPSARLNDDEAVKRTVAGPDAQTGTATRRVVPAAARTVTDAARGPRSVTLTRRPRGAVTEKTSVPGGPHSSTEPRGASHPSR